MKINNNISAVITNKHLLGTESSLTAAMERLSSGLKLNHASDNPSGMAISNKMRAQIQGLDQASRNASDGTSVLQTADGALGEVTDMLQRMRELAVQASNGINSKSEKESCQLELASLREEIDRISETTEFNAKNLLDGSLDARIYADAANVNNVSRLSVSDTVGEGTYKLTVDEAAERASTTLGTNVNTLVGKDGSFTVNGSKIEINSSMTREEVLEAVREGLEYGGCEMDDLSAAADPYSTNISFHTKAYGAHEAIMMIQDFETYNIAGVPNIATNPDAQAAVMDEGADPKTSFPTDSNFGKNATATYDGNRVTITDANGFKMSMYFEAGFTGTVSLDVTEIGVMDLQIGANEGQTMQLRIPATDVKSLYLDDVDLATVNGAKKALERLDDALTQISSIRSQIGAFENRLDYTVKSLDETEENMTEALSRIEDADMAEEMTEYTKNNVLEQAGISALSQANSLPELALQILGN